MKNGLWLAAPLFLILVLALGEAWRSLRSNHLTEAERVQLSVRRAEIEAKIKNAGDRLNKAQQMQAGAEARQETRGKAPFPAARFAISDEVLVSSDPKLQTLYLKSQAAQQRNNMAPFYHALGLSAEQIKKLDDLNLQGAEQAADLRWAARTQGANMNDPDYRALFPKITDQVNAGARAVLGEAAYRGLQELEREAPVSYVVGQVGAAMAPTATVLSREQAAQLTQILANASSNYQAGKMAVLPSVDWDTALTQAQGILSEPQLASLKAIIAGYQQSQIYSKLAQITLRGN
jgi:hypothetical protein